MDDQLLQDYYSEAPVVNQLSFLKGVQSFFENTKIFYKKSYCGVGKHSVLWFYIYIVLAFFSELYNLYYYTKTDSVFFHTIYIFINYFLHFFYLHAILNCKSLNGFGWQILYAIVLHGLNNFAKYLLS